MDEKLCKNILIYDILCKFLIGAKPLRIMFDKVNEFIRDYDRTKYFVLFGLKKHDAIYDKIRYLAELKIGIAYVFSYNYAKVKINSDDDLPLEETLNLHNAIILTKSVFNKDQNHYYHNTFLDKCTYELA